jgi:hypothetical protein
MSNSFSWTEPASWFPALIELFEANPVLIVLAVLVAVAAISLITRFSVIVLPVVLVVFFGILVFMFGETAFQLFIGSVYPAELQILTI